MPSPKESDIADLAIRFFKVIPQGSLSGANKTSFSGMIWRPIQFRCRHAVTGQQTDHNTRSMEDAMACSEGLILNEPQPHRQGDYHRQNCLQISLIQPFSLVLAESGMIAEDQLKNKIAGLLMPCSAIVDTRSPGRQLAMI